MLNLNKKNNNDELTTNVDELEGLPSGESQSVETFDEPYVAPNQLHIPQEAQDQYESMGFALQWVRIYVPNSNGALDSKNIIKKESDKYEFVLRKDISGLTNAMTSFFGEEIDKGSHGLYIVGDLALAKIPQARIAQKRRSNNRKTRSRSEAVLSDLKNNEVLPSSERGEGWKIEHSRPEGKETDFG